MILVDASVLLAAEDTDDVHHQDANALLQHGSPLATVDLAYYEVTNVADVVWRDPAAGRRLRQRVELIATFGTFVRADRALAEAAAELASIFGISAYDAGYVAAARQVGATLVSCDVRDLVGNRLAQLPGATRT